MLAAVIGLYVVSQPAGPGHLRLGRRCAQLDLDPGRAEAGCSSASSSPSRSRRRWCRSTPGCPTPVPRRRSAARRAAGRRAGQGRHVRLPALLPAAVPATRRAASRRWCWCWRWSASSTAALLAVGQKRHEAAGRPTPRSPTSASSRWASSPSPRRRGAGAVLYMVNHGLATGLLFLVVGMLVARGGSRHDRRLRRRRPSSRPVLAGVLPARRAGVAGAAGHERVRQRVPGAGRLVPARAGVHDHRHRRHHPGRRCTCCWMYQRTMQGPLRGGPCSTPSSRGAGRRPRRDDRPGDRGPPRGARASPTCPARDRGGGAADRR